MEKLLTVTLLVFLSSCASIATDSSNWPLSKIKKALKPQSKSIHCLGWYEMRGKKQKVFLGRINNQHKLGCKKNPKLKFPGLFITWSNPVDKEFKVALMINNQIDESLPETQDNSEMVILWEATLSNKHIEAMNEIRIIPTKGTGLDDLELTYTLKPGKSSRPMRPGPPIQKRYLFDGETYKVKK